MPLTGKQIIGNNYVDGLKESFMAVNPTNGQAIEPSWKGADDSQINQAIELASKAFNAYRLTDLETRAKFLDTIALKINELGDELIDRAMLETGLPKARLEGERARTTNQLKIFANLVRKGNWLDARIDPAIPDRKPMPRSDIRLNQIPVGPVAVFGASNFPLAFSVAGGDTASALAAGAPVVVKAHPAHPGTSELVGSAIQKAAQECRMPEGVFSLLLGSDIDLGIKIVTHKDIQAVGFTGSRQAGIALMKAAFNRPVPIPVFAEMSSTNPVFLLPEALSQNNQQIADGFITSLTGSAGQLCTNPGLIIALEGPDLDKFVETAISKLKQTPATTMLSTGIAKNYQQGVEKLIKLPTVKQLAQGESSEVTASCQANLAITKAADFLNDIETLGAEIFGASSLIVSCKSFDEFKQIAQALEGQLTATIHMVSGKDDKYCQELIPILEVKSGRILFNGFPTGVEVCDAMVHGGPFPATSNSQTTSVGTLAIRRFLRPVCYQDIPDNLLPEPLKESNPWNINREIS